MSDDRGVLPRPVRPKSLGAALRVSYGALRSRFSFSNTGASEKVNRSSWRAACRENSVQAGTAMMSPRSSGSRWSFSRTAPAPSKTCQTEDAEVRDGRVAAPARSRWNSVRMVVSASPPRGSRPARPG